VEPDNIASCVKTAYEYADGYGNKTKATTANCARAPFRSDSNSTLAPQRRSYAPTPAQTVTIGGTTMNVPQGMFPITVINALTQSETRTFDPALAFPCSSSSNLPVRRQLIGADEAARERQSGGQRSGFSLCVRH